MAAKNNMFKNKKIKQCIIFVVALLLLFFLNYRNFKTYHIKRVNNISETNIKDERKISEKQLFSETWNIIKNNYYDKSLNHQNWNRWKKRYNHKIKDSEDAYVAINSMLLSLDDSYSKFLSHKEFEEQNSTINSKLYGIGINIAAYSGKIYIINVLDNTPAKSADIKSGDIILKINDTDIKGQSVYEVAKLIRGNIDESITLEILRGVEKYSKTLKRQEIKLKTIEAKKVSDKIGYIRISSFVGVNTPQDFIIALNRLIDTKALIIDLRGNSGGLFQNAVLIANLFMKKGVIVNVVARNGKENIYSAKDDGCIYENPVVILIDSHSASASEILASALGDNNIATIIGTRSFGKGLVQKVYSMPNQTGMNLTIAKYLTPKGININKNGIKPDYTVNFSRNDLIDNNDSQLNFAIDYLEKNLID